MVYTRYYSNYSTKKEGNELDVFAAQRFKFGHIKSSCHQYEVRYQYTLFPNCKGNMGIFIDLSNDGDRWEPVYSTTPTSPKATKTLQGL